MQRGELERTADANNYNAAAVRQNQAAGPTTQAQLSARRSP